MWPTTSKVHFVTLCVYQGAERPHSKTPLHKNLPSLLLIHFILRTLGTPSKHREELQEGEEGRRSVPYRCKEKVSKRNDQRCWNCSAAPDRQAQAWGGWRRCTWITVILVLWKKKSVKAGSSYRGWVRISEWLPLILPLPSACRSVV